MVATGRLGIRVLGELTATYDDSPLDLGGPRQRAVLALLLLARGDVVPADRLVESLWGEQPVANAAAALQSYVSHLRRRLEPGSAARERSGVITREGPGYAVRLPGDAVDAWEFEALLQQADSVAEPARVTVLLREALQLWRGPALADYADEPWAEAEAVRLTDLRAVARERLLAARLGCGESALLVPELEVLVAEEPLREERWRLLVLALYRAQRQADALAALRRARATLADELGVDPGPALRELEGEVLAQSPALDVPRQRDPGTTRARVPSGARSPGHDLSGGTPTSSGGAPDQPGSCGQLDVLVDRDREVAVLHRALDGLAAGEPGLVLIEGPAGIGKTRLLSEVRRLAAQRGYRVLAARGSQMEKSFGFGAVRQLFEPVLADPGQREEALTGAASSARGVFDLAAVDQRDGSFAVLHGLYWLTATVSRKGPLVLCLDDLQWCDSASLRYLAYLLRRLDTMPVLMVGTIRSGERHEDEDLLDELALDPVTVVVRPVPLSPEGSAVVVRQRLGEAATSFLDACHRTTSGNPLLLRQLLRALEADGVHPDAAHVDTVVAVGSRAVSSMVLLRLRRLPTDAMHVARALAVLGEGTHLPAVAALAGVAEDRAADALAALTRAEVVKDAPPLGFVHPLVRDAVYRDLPAVQRELQHERAAAVLQSWGASPEQVGAHLLLAPHRGRDETVAVLRQAARTAADRGAPDSAVTHLRRALQEPPSGPARAEVLIELGLLETLLDGPAAISHLLEAHALVDDPVLRGEVAIAIARSHVFASPRGVATAFARHAATDLPPELADVRQGLLALQRISGFLQGLPPTQWGEGPGAAPEGTGTGALMLAASLSAETMLGGRDRRRAVELAQAALDGDRLWKVDNGLLWVVAAVTRMVADDDLTDFWCRARSEAHARGSLFAALATNLWEGFWRWRRGELSEALACVRAAEEQDRMWQGSGLGAGFIHAMLVGIHVDRGDRTAARQVASAAAHRPMMGEGLRHLQHSTARLFLAEGRYEDALTVLEPDVVPLRVENPVWEPRRGLRAAALRGLGRVGEAVESAEDEVASLRRWGAPGSLGAGLRLLGEIRGRDGQEQLREAVALLEPTTAALERARARHALACHPDVPDGEAVPLLKAALAEAHECGAAGLRASVRLALASRGQAPPAAAVTPALSATERRVLDLTAAGLDVHEVAQTLFLTPGSVRSALDQTARHPDRRT